MQIKDFQMYHDLKCTFVQYVNHANFSWKVIVGIWKRAVKGKKKKNEISWIVFIERDVSGKCWSFSDYILQLCAKHYLHFLHQNWHKHWCTEMTYPRRHKPRCVQRYFEVNLELEKTMVYEYLNTSGERKERIEI